MFKVYEKGTDKEFSVFQINTENGKTNFLVYDVELDQFIYRACNEFRAMPLHKLRIARDLNINDAYERLRYNG